MKNLNNYFLVLFCLVLMYSCSSEYSEENDAIVKTELNIEKSDLKYANSQVDPTNNTASAKGGDGGGDWMLCYNAFIKYDYECDGTFSPGVNIPTSSYICCSDKVAELTLTAIQNQWCYSYGNNGQCKKINCTTVAFCDDSTGM